LIRREINKMLRQIYIIHDGKIIYERSYGKALSIEDLNSILPNLIETVFSRLGEEQGSWDYFKFKLNFLANNEKKLLFILVTGLSDDFTRIRTELLKLAKEFLNLFQESIGSGLDNTILTLLDPLMDGIHRNLKPKISLVGFSGVGKTTITQLILAREIPLQHVPTITGEVATVKIGKLIFLLWDFAGQEQFSFLWNKFIQGSDAVLLISNSTLENLEKSKFFLELISEEAPHAYSAIIGNKQDLPDSVPVDEIERIMGVKTYSMIAIEPNNREKMIKIIADILDMSPEVSPLLKPIIERDGLVKEAQIALENGDFHSAAQKFERIADICLEIGDDTLSKEFFEKSIKLSTI